jgi:Proteolysis_6 C-terminal
MILPFPQGKPSFSLARLPKSFVELYSIVNKVKGRDDATTMDDTDDTGSAETAICLVSGAVLRSGSTRRSFSRAVSCMPAMTFYSLHNTLSSCFPITELFFTQSRPPGACTLHARKNGSGIGIFFLVQKCTVLLMHNNKSAYSASLYVDEHGEEDPGLRRGRPLFLNEARYQALELLWRQHGVPREVAQIRSTSDRVIRDNWY